jgi:hypothetical protein
MNVSPIDRTMSLPMRTKEELIKEVETRNKLRAEAGLPLVSVPKEIEKISKAERYRDFCDWCEANPILRAKVAEEVLATFREERGDLSWVPRGYLNGAGAYGACLRERMRQIWEEERMRLRD